MSTKYPLRPLVSQWRSVLKRARDSKKILFTDDAHECMRLYYSDLDFMWDRNNPRSLIGNPQMEQIDAPYFKFVFNVAFEVVSIFGPVLYHKNPTRQVTAREPIELAPELFVDPAISFQIQQLQQQLQQIQQAAGGGQEQQQPGQAPAPPPDPRLQFQMQQMQMQMQQLQQTSQQQQNEFQMLQLKQQARYTKDKTRAKILEKVLNYTPHELGLKRHLRDTIDETLIKGMGCCWTQLHQPPGSKMMMAGSFYDTIDNLLMDPDAQQVEDIQWIARQCIHPTWLVEKKYDLKKGTIKGGLESYQQQANIDAADDEGRESRRRGETNDLCRYWEVYSKMGVGTRLKVAGSDKDLLNSKMGKMGPVLDQFGENVLLVVSDTNDFFLNVPQDALDTEPVDELSWRFQWPIPFWADSESSWPMTPLEFHRVPNCIWPMSHLRPALGEIRFITWCLSFLANKIRLGCEDLIGCIKSAGEEIKSQLLQPANRGYRLIELEDSAGKKLGDVLSVMQLPPFKNDVWQVVAAVSEKIEKRLGLTEAAYGQSDRQIRSSAEAQGNQHAFSVRPDDMANTVEDFSTTLARKEALAARWHLRFEDVAPIIGEECAGLWEQLVMDENISDLMREFHYRVEGGSSKKPNKDREAANLQQTMQVIAPAMEKYMERTGDSKPFNGVIRRWGKSLDMPLEEIDELMIPPIPPAPDPKMQLAQMQAQIDQQKAQQEQQAAQMDMQLKQQESEMELQGEQIRLAMERQQGQQELEIESALAAQEIGARERETAVEVNSKKALAGIDLLIARQKGALDLKMGEQKIALAKKAAAAKPKPTNGKK